MNIRLNLEKTHANNTIFFQLEPDLSSGLKVEANGIDLLETDVTTLRLSFSICKKGIKFPMPVEMAGTS